MRAEHSRPELDQARDIERAVQALANAIGPRRPWVLVVDDAAGVEQLFTSETPERARSLLRRAAERRRP